MTNHWWRAYNEAVDDPKLILLSDKAHRAWFNLMCVASANGGILPEIKFIAVKLRITPQQASAIITELVQAELIDKRDDDRFEPHNWNGRQYKSDVSTDRVKRFRERERNVSVTPPETETETETEKQPSLRSGGAEPAPAKPKRARARAALPDDWALDEQDIRYAADLGFDVPAIERMTSGFANHHRSRGNLMADWHAAWRTWTDNEIKFSNSRSPRNQGRTDAPGQTGSKIIQASDDLLARTIASFDGPNGGDGGLRGGSLAPAPRLLSHR